MAVEIEPPEPDLSNIRKHLRNNGQLWRLGAWGGAAAVALATLAITTQTDRGSERLQLAFAAEQQPSRVVATAPIAPRAVEKDADTQRLEAQVRALAADRDRLTARLANLERSLDDMTGSIKRQAAQEAPAATAQSAAPAPSAPATAQPLASPAPAPSLPATAPEAALALPPAIAPLAMPAHTDIPAPWFGMPVPAASPSAEAVPLPPSRVAAAPAAEPAAERLRPAKVDVGIDLGGAPNMLVLNARWAAVKANFGPLLNGLHPLAAHNRRPGSTEVRLVVGPLPNATAATQLCARFAAARVICRPAKFDGEQFAQR